MPPPEPVTLALAIARADVHVAADFIDDRAGRIGVLALAEQARSSVVAECYHSKTVLLAIPSQRDTIAALIALDGVARRLILWPQDRPADQIARATDAARADVVVTEWPADTPTQNWVANKPSAANDEATAWILFTSGTSGQPKMIVHTLHSLAGHIRPGPADRPRPIWCTFYDTRRYGGLQIALRALIGGGSLVLSDGGESMAAVLLRARHAAATHFLGTPSHWRLALMADAQDIIAPDYVRLSGEVADQTILDTLSRIFPQAALVHAFASTEAGLAFEVTDRRAGFPPSLMDFSGDGPELRVVEGMLQVCSERGAKGILDGIVVPIAGPDGFIDTGDAVAWQDERFVFAGRRDGIVNVGGQKVFPEEVEAVINQHPAVRMSRVSARRNAITGAVVSAELVQRDGGAPVAPIGLPEDVIRFCRERLPAHKVPVSIRLVPSLEVAPSGKLVRLRA